MKKKANKKTFKKKTKEFKDNLSKNLGIPLKNNVDDIVEYKMKKGKKELAKVKEEAIKQFNPKIIEEFDKLAKKKAKKIKGKKPKERMGDNLRLKKKMIENVKKLVHPLKTIKKKKEIEVLFPEK